MKVVFYVSCLHLLQFRFTGFDFLMMMMALRPFVSVICILLVFISCTETNYLTAIAKYNQPQREIIIADIIRCFVHTPRFFSIKMTKMTMFNCMGKFISHCVKSHFNADDHQHTAVLSQGSTYCGMVTFNTGQLYFPKFVHIKVHKGFVIQLYMLSFDFAWTRFGCESHALSFPDTLTSDGVFFCGKRLPWTMVKTDTEAYIKLSIIPYLQFKANIFYSSYILSRLQHFKQHTYIHSGYGSDTVLQWAQNHYLKTETFIYHIVTHPMYSLGFDAMELNLGDSKLYFYDGPGVLSKLFFVLNRASLKTFKVLNLRTSAFCAFITLKKSSKSTVVFRVKTNSKQNIRAPLCRHRPDASSVVVKSTAKNMCYEKFENIENSAPSIHIYRFIFTGAGMITGQDSAWNCQYGGLFVKFADTLKVINICETHLDYNLWGMRKFLQIMIVFYTGYSEGEAYLLLMGISSYFCPTYYIDRDVMGSSDQLTTYRVDPDPYITCLVVVCSSQYMGDNKLCKISFVADRGEIGVSSLKVTFTHTLYPCVSSNYKYNDLYNITALSTENWPIGIARYSQQSGRKNLSPTYRHIQSIDITYLYAPNTIDTFHSFEYLYTANISLPLICEKDKFLQMAVELRQSKCGSNFRNHKDGRPMYYRAFNYTLQLEKACTNTYIHIAPGAYRHFIYTSNIGQAGSGFLIKYIYDMHCPRECRAYHYVVTVLREEEQTVYEYTSPFGQGIYTGFHNQGFKATVIPHVKKLPSYCGRCNFVFNAVRISDFKEDNELTTSNFIYRLNNTR